MPTKLSDADIAALRNLINQTFPFDGRLWIQKGTLWPQASHASGKQDRDDRVALKVTLNRMVNAERQRGEFK